MSLPSVKRQESVKIAKWWAVRIYWDDLSVSSKSSSLPRHSWQSNDSQTGSQNINPMRWFIKRHPERNTFGECCCMLVSLAEVSCVTLVGLLGAVWSSLCYLAVFSLCLRWIDLEDSRRRVSESSLPGSFLWAYWCLWNKCRVPVLVLRSHHLVAYFVPK